MEPLASVQRYTSAWAASVIIEQSRKAAILGMVSHPVKLSELQSGAAVPRLQLYTNRTSVTGLGSTVQQFNPVLYQHVGFGLQMQLAAHVCRHNADGIVHGQRFELVG